MAYVTPDPTKLNALIRALQSRIDIRSNHISTLERLCCDNSAEDRNFRRVAITPMALAQKIDKDALKHLHAYEQIFFGE